MALRDYNGCEGKEVWESSNHDHPRGGRYEHEFDTDAEDTASVILRETKKISPGIILSSMRTSHET